MGKSTKGFVMQGGVAGNLAELSARGVKMNDAILYL
jgi:hypothetical protein